MASGNVIEVDVVSKFDARGTNDAKKATKEYGDGLEKAGEQAGASETRIIGVHDVIDGTATIMQGPGKQGMVSYIQGWADLAGGVEGVLPLLKAMSISAVKNGAAQVAAATKTVAAWLAMKATAVASAVMMAAAWVVSLGPIVLVIATLVAIGAAFVVLWKKSETFRDIVKGALHVVLAPTLAVAGAVKSIWGWMGSLIGLAAKFIGWIKGIGSAFNSIISPIRSAVGWLERFIADSLIGGQAKFKFSASTDSGGAGGGVSSGNASHRGFASGGITPAGWSRINEHGDESMFFPAGSRVRSNPDSRGYAGGGLDVTITVAGGDGKLMRAIRDSIQVAVRTQAGGSVQRWAGSGAS